MATAKSSSKSKHKKAPATPSMPSFSPMQLQPAAARKAVQPDSGPSSAPAPTVLDFAAETSLAPSISLRPNDAARMAELGGLRFRAASSPPVSPTPPLSLSSAPFVSKPDTPKLSSQPKLTPPSLHQDAHVPSASDYASSPKSDSASSPQYAKPKPIQTTQPTIPSSLPSQAHHSSSSMPAPSWAPTNFQTSKLPTPQKGLQLAPLPLSPRVAAPNIPPSRPQTPVAMASTSSSLASAPASSAIRAPTLPSSVMYTESPHHDNAPESSARPALPVSARPSPPLSSAPSLATEQMLPPSNSTSPVPSPRSPSFFVTPHLIVFIIVLVLLAILFILMQSTQVQ